MHAKPASRYRTQCAIRICHWGNAITFAELAVVGRIREAVCPGQSPTGILQHIVKNRPANQVKTTPIAATQGGYAYDSSPQDFVEGVGQGNDLRPLSLYLDQLDRRQQESQHMHTYQVEVVVKNAGTGEVIPETEVRI